MPARRVAPERLDDLPPDDPDARRSRRDLQRVHRAMRSLTILKAAIASLRVREAPRAILELGAGDGSLMLRLARSLWPAWQGVHVTFLDRHDLVSPATRRAFAALDWRVEVLPMDALDWARSSADVQYDLCITTLFLHHLVAGELAGVLAGVCARTQAFIACEPRRAALARAGSHLLGFLGANAVTREDAVTSVEAGFAGHELSAHWPGSPGAWQSAEYFAWPFTHCFVAKHRPLQA